MALRAADFFVLFTPLRPVDAAREPEVALADPWVRRALADASPGLYGALVRGDGEGTGKRARGVRRALARYLARMTLRATPRGLLAGVTVGRFGDRNLLRLDRRRHYRVSERVDLATLRSAARGADLPLRVNPTASVDGGRAWFLDRGALSELELEPPLDGLLEAAAEPAPRPALAALCRDDGGDDLIEALCDCRFLVPADEPTQTGDAAAARYRELLAGAGVSPAVLDAAPPHRDLVKPAQVASLSRAVSDIIAAGAETLLAVASRPSPWLEGFARRFHRRFGAREVRLIDAVDPVFGVRLGDAPQSRVPGLPLPPRRAPDPGPDPRAAILAALLERCPPRAVRLELTDDDVARLAGPSPLPPPRAASVRAAVVAASEHAFAAGEVEVVIERVRAPSAVGVLGRFAAIDRELEVRLRDLAEREAALVGERAVIADVVAAAPALGSAAVRPSLRDYEIPVGGIPGAPRSRWLPVTDLWLALRGGRLAVRSRRLDVEVVPAIGNAHSFDRDPHGVYRLLGELQAQGCARVAEWRWGASAGAREVLPRVIHGRSILARARWRWRGSVAGVRDLGCPRYVRLFGAGGALVADLEREDDRASLAHAADNAASDAPLWLEELWPGPEQACVRGAEGRFHHELVVPLVASEPAPAEAWFAPPAPTPAAPPAPGPWSTHCIYVAPAAADRIVSTVVRPLADRARADGRADGWFFLRMAEAGNDWHVRVRFRGAPEGLRAIDDELVHELERLEPAGVIERVAPAAYRRETARYGGEAALDRVERLFEADSDAASDPAVIALGPDRWRAALRALAVGLVDLGVDDVSALALASAHVERLDRHHRRAARQVVAEGYRALRAEVEALVAGGREPWAHAIDARSRAWRQVAPDWAAACAPGARTGAITGVLHVGLTRWLPAPGPSIEVVLFELLRRALATRCARARRPTP